MVAHRVSLLVVQSGNCCKEELDVDNISIIITLICFPLSVTFGALVLSGLIFGRHCDGDQITFLICVVAFVISFIGFHSYVRDGEYGVDPIRLVCENDYVLTFEVKVDDELTTRTLLREESERSKIRTYYQQESQRILMGALQAYKGEIEGLEQFVMEQINGKSFQMNKNATVRFFLKSLSYEPYQIGSQQIFF